MVLDMSSEEMPIRLNSTWLNQSYFIAIDAPYFVCDSNA